MSETNPESKSANELAELHHKSPSEMPKSDETRLTLSSSDSGSSAKEYSSPVPCFCLDLSRLPTNVQFVLLSSSVFGCYLIYGYVQEWIFRQDGIKPHG